MQRTGGMCLKKYSSFICGIRRRKSNQYGYPDGLSRKQIPLCARIMAVADVFDAVSQSGVTGMQCLWNNVSRSLKKEVVWILIRLLRRHFLRKDTRCAEDVWAGTGDGKRKIENMQGLSSKSVIDLLFSFIRNEV